MNKDNINSQYVSQLQIDEFFGVCRGISSNDSICKEEAVLLFDWLSEFDSLSSKWPYSLLHSRLEKMIRNGELSNVDGMELKKILHDLLNVLKN